MNKINFICVIIVMASHLLSMANIFATDKKFTSERKTITKKLLPESDPSGTPVILTYESIIFDPAKEITEIDEKKWDKSSPESSYRGIYTANKRGNAEWIIRGFVPLERERIRNMVTNKELLDKNTMVHSSISKEYLVQEIFYGNYIILMVFHVNKNGDQWPMDYTFKETKEGWLLTNKLSQDLFFSKVIELTRPTKVRFPKE